ncbi:hypothetical protein TYRP_001454 [Tyrophagus putrescentiae]|nr:hypothetical protein TYRP_001454 [Tyrophagus putrescentiae]
MKKKPGAVSRLPGARSGAAEGHGRVADVDVAVVGQQGRGEADDEHEDHQEHLPVPPAVQVVDQGADHEAEVVGHPHPVDQLVAGVVDEHQVGNERVEDFAADALKAHEKRIIPAKNPPLADDKEGKTARNGNRLIDKNAPISANHLKPFYGKGRHQHADAAHQRIRGDIPLIKFEVNFDKRQNRRMNRGDSQP